MSQKNNSVKDRYRAYLISGWWMKIRQEALERADNHCMICGNVDELDVHHNTYERLGDERLSDLVVLCRECHTLYHAQLESGVEQNIPIVDQMTIEFGRCFPDLVNRVWIKEFSPEGVVTVLSNCVRSHQLRFNKNSYLSFFKRRWKGVSDIKFWVG